ncbi:NDP-hexose 2,3-dehydratase family protein [Streptomyces decoyicus]|uniref:NDP-hexose 2,3-dehydratase family protein n=1 Tax=Streptomyces decoyicus TaxID=249567 RepID=UPI0004ABBE96|nr:NDP-hexose 2,3-dehydratase family protein [Streptomyces decoyicus]KOG47577.1 NDP-hexose 2,3-dehydratase [Streptomyces decoyicus]QZY19381.1 NDP-hexose 2,3-dehydratase family protein [Streptomyces decoyicus]
MATATPSRTAADLAERCARSAAVTEAGSWLRTAEVPGWMAERHASHRFAVRRIPFAALTGWSFAAGTGNLRHDSGRFFTVEGLQVSVGTGPFPHWQQPIIKQPEVGILGILAKEFDGVLHFLMQAKMEPGNRNLLQLSPTVQATRSNYTKVHRGADVRYLDHFLRPAPGSVVADVLQSEHGSWFFRKSNRNMIVETRDEVPVAEDFCWLTLGQIGRLLRRDNVVNMDARSVLACVPTGGAPGSGAPYGDTDLLSWFTAERSRHTVSAERIPLDVVAGWRRGPDTIERPDGRYFRVVAVAVEAGSREVTGWSQPLIEPCGIGVTAFLTRRVGGVLQVLVHARVEGGFLDTVELGPTVQCVPGNHAALPPGDRPPFLDTVLTAGPGRIRYAAAHSEEGGRFLNAESRYLLVEAADDMPEELPPGYRWVTPGMLGALVRHGHYLNVQARSLLSLLTTGAAGLQD